MTLDAYDTDAGAYGPIDLYGPKWCDRDGWNEPDVVARLVDWLRRQGHTLELDEVIDVYYDRHFAAVVVARHFGDRAHRLHETTARALRRSAELEAGR